jgi:hypothetical protein
MLRSAGAEPQGSGLSRPAEAPEEKLNQIAVKRPTAESTAHPVSSSRAAGTAQPVPGRSRATAPPPSPATGTIASVATPLSSLTSALATDRASPGSGDGDRIARNALVRARPVETIAMHRKGRPIPCTPNQPRSRWRGDGRRCAHVAAPRRTRPRAVTRGVTASLRRQTAARARSDKQRDARPALQGASW